METLVGVFRCILPRRYWQEMRRGAVLSILLTIGVGAAIGLSGLVAYVGRASEQAAKAAIQVGTGGGVGGLDQTAQMTAALQGSPIISALAFFLFTPTGWLADYLSPSTTPGEIRSSPSSTMRFETRAPRINQ